MSLEWRLVSVPVGHSVRPRQDIAIGIVIVMQRIDPGANQDLEHGVKAVEAEEVVDSSLSGRLRSHPCAGVWRTCVNK